MKKLLSLILCLILCLSLFACNSEAGQTTKATEDTKHTKNSQNTDSTPIKNDPPKLMSLNIDGMKAVKAIIASRHMEEEKKSMEFGVSNHLNSIQEILTYLGNYKLKKLEDDTSPFVKQVSFKVVFADDAELFIFFGSNKVQAFSSADNKDTYEIVSGDTVTPLAFFKTLEQSYKPLTPPQIEIDDSSRFQEAAMTVTDGKIRIDDRDLICVIVEASGWNEKSNKSRIQDSGDLKDIKDALTEASFTTSGEGKWSIPTGSKKYSVQLYFADGTLMLFSIYDTYLNTSNIEYRAENINQIFAIKEALRWS